MEQLSNSELEIEFIKTAAGIFEQFPDSIRQSRLRGVPIESVELAAPGIISCLVLRTTDSLAPETQIIIYKNSEPLIDIEEIFYSGEMCGFRLNTYRHNNRDKDMWGFGTKYSIGDIEATADHLNKVKDILAEATINPNPQANIGVR